MISIMKIALIGTCFCGAAGIAASQSSQAIHPMPVSSHLTNGAVTESQAKEIALSNAGLTEKDVAFRRVYEKFDYGRTKIKIEFVHDGTEYEYEIDSATGQILNINMDSNTR